MVAARRQSRGEGVEVDGGGAVAEGLLEGDAHEAVVAWQVACLLVGGSNEKLRKEVRSFGTMTRDLS